MKGKLSWYLGFFNSFWFELVRFYTAGTAILIKPKPHNEIPLPPNTHKGRIAGWRVGGGGVRFRMEARRGR